MLVDGAPTYRRGNVYETSPIFSPRASHVIILPLPPRILFVPEPAARPSRRRLSSSTRCRESREESRGLLVADKFTDDSIFRPRSLFLAEHLRVLLNYLSGIAGSRVGAGRYAFPCRSPRLLYFFLRLGSSIDLFAPVAGLVFLVSADFPRPRRGAGCLRGASSGGSSYREKDSQRKETRALGASGEGYALTLRGAKRPPSERRFARGIRGTRKTGSDQNVLRPRRPSSAASSTE